MGTRKEEKSPVPQTYITQAEQWILSFLAAGQFCAEDRQLYQDHVSPRLIRSLLETHDYEDALVFMTYVIDRVEIRHGRAKDRRLKYELACYRSWLMNMRAQIEADYAPEERRDTMIAMIQRYFGRHSHHA